jgi:2-dehydropantoate 2-reductase
MQILIIGAGAVGSAYGYYASIAGNRVSYSIKPKYRAGLERGMTLYHWKGRRAETIRFEGYELFDSIDALRGKTFDAVLLTLPSDKLKEGDWFERLLTVVGDAKIWSLQPNATDIEWIAEKIGKNADARLVWGRIPILSYLAPLPGEGFEKPGYAFYLPPGAKALWSSKTPALAEEAAKTFEAGGLNSKATATDFRKLGILPENLLRMVVAGLEKSEWSFDRLLNGENLYLVREGLRESTAIYAKRYGVSDPSKSVFGRIGSSLFGVRTALRVARMVIPFDLEAFFRVHFTKVERQMHEALDELVAYGKRNGFSTTNLTLLRGRKRERLSDAVRSGPPSDLV